MADLRFLNVGTINKTQKGTYRICFGPEYVSKGNYSYDNLIDLYETLGQYLEDKPKNDAGYPEALGLRVKNIAQELDKSLAAGKISEDLHQQISNRRRFEVFDMELIIEG
jgi:hypothetical protein